MHEIKMPQLGQSVEEASIIEWFKKEGDEVKQGEPLFSIQTDKAEIECESTAAGSLRKILVPPDEFVPIMTVVALVGEPDEELPDLSQYGAGEEQPAEKAPAEEPAEAPAKAAEAPAQAAAAPAQEPAARAEAGPVSPRARAKAAELGVDPTGIPGSGVGGRVVEEDVVAHAGAAPKASPVAKRIAEQWGVDLATVQGTGSHGRIMKEDVEKAAAAPAEARRPAAAAAPSGKGEVVPLTPMRRVIAERMAESMFSAPHYYMTVKIDVSEAKAFRSRCDGFRPSHNELVLWACALALQEFPLVNARWLGDGIEMVEDVNLGIAVAVPNGLVVPVVKQVQNMTLQDMHHEARVLIKKARDGKLTPADYKGNTFTVSNLGGFGIDQFTAIINQPDSAILAVGEIKDQVVVIKGGIHIRPIMKLTLSSDHRVIDGAVAAQFLGRVREIIEKAEF